MKQGVYSLSCVGLSSVRTQEEGVDIREGVGISEIRQGSLTLKDGTQQGFDECLWCTQASAPTWLSKTGLQTGAQLVCLLTHGQAHAHAH